MDDPYEVLALVSASSVLAAMITAVTTQHIERKKQLRERKLIVAGDFAGGAMEVLAHLRNYRPTKHQGHRNEQLHMDAELLRRRAEKVNLSLDELRPMRGPVWLFFPGRSSIEALEHGGSQTTADWAETVVGLLQDMQDICDEFWRSVHETSGEREALERFATERYRAARSKAWEAVNEFAATAAKRV